MFRIIDCITVDHDIPILLLALAICVSGSLASVMVSGRARVASERAAEWTALLGVCIGATAWSTHFVAMLAYKTGLPMTYDLLLTACSLLAGIALAALGSHLARIQSSQARAALFGGTIVGCGVIVLHYLGMAGLNLPGVLTYDPVYVTASVLLSVGLGAGAMNTLFGRPRANKSLIGVLLLVAMIASLHFTGMAAIELSLDPELDPVSEGVSRLAIILAVTVSAFATLGIGTVAAIIDRRLSNYLAAEAQRFKTLSDGAFEGLVIHRHGVIQDANTAARELLELQEPINQYDLREWIEQLATPIGDGAEQIGEVELPGANGKIFPAEICRRRIQLANEKWGELVAIRDLTARKKSDATIAHLALHDALTDLPNRRFFGELASKTLEQAARTGRSFAVIAMDLDNFKIVNDVYGHAAGDQLIQTVAVRLNETLGNGDVVARLGGDEFALLETSPRHPQCAAALAERIIEALKTPIALDVGGRKSTVNINTSIGIAVYPFDGDTIDQLLRSADTAMYQAKSSGKATYRFFELAMNQVSEERHRLEEGLRNALSRKSLNLVYQPIVGSDSREPICFEALLRWHDHELGQVSPDRFIPVAETSGLIKPIGDFVLLQACQDASQWPSPVRVAVNLSAVQFKGNDLIGSVTAALAQSGLPGERLELEITESVLIDNREDALRQLNELKSLGIRIAMDDFGTGYSSLSYLQSFGFDKLKIDRAFISDLENNKQHASIVRAVVSMGQSLSMQVVAEGVETDAQATRLADMSCDQLQGYLIAKPMASEKVEEFLASVKRRHGAALTD